MEQLIDKFGRNIEYVRISVTDRCNFRCIYCMPEDGIHWKPMENILTYEDIAYFIKIAAQLGISKVKLTGGEPLIRKNVERLIGMIKSVDGIKEISMTTNGFFLKDYAGLLKSYGLDRVTISLDTLNKEKYAKITRIGTLSNVLAGFDALDSVGFKHTKINTVVMKTLNDNDVVDLVNFSVNRGYDIRFIEFMPAGFSKEWNNYFISLDGVFNVLNKHFDMEHSNHKSNGPSVYYKVKNGYVGFITPLSKSFCSFCNRIRLSSDGKIIPCLGNPMTIGIKAALKAKDDANVKSFIKKAIHIKPACHGMLNEAIRACMAEIGG